MSSGAHTSGAGVRRVRKAVIPAAGFGTRFLPATKAVPKEMLPVIDTPTIEFVVREAIDSGLDDILIILSAGKEAIAAHFGRNADLEARLEATGKMEELATIRPIAEGVRIHYVFQHKLSGLGDAVRYARAHVGNEPFAVLLGDTILEGVRADGVPAAGTPASGAARPVTRQLLDVYAAHGKSVVAVEEVPEEKVSRYGIVAGSPLADTPSGEETPAAGRAGAAGVADGLGAPTFQLTDLVEKPAADVAPSRLAISSRYVFTTAIFDALDTVKPGKGGEIQLTDAMRAVQQGEGMLGLQFKGRRFDMGNRLDFLKAVVEFALRRDDLGPEFGDWLREIVGRD